MRSWRWAKVCPKHVELILEINKTVIVASHWFPYYLTYIDDVRSNTNQVYTKLCYRWLKLDLLWCVRIQKCTGSIPHRIVKYTKQSGTPWQPSLHAHATFYSFIHCDMSWNRPTASSKQSCPQSANYCFLFQLPLASLFLKVNQQQITSSSSSSHLVQIFATIKLWSESVSAPGSVCTSFKLFLLISISWCFPGIQSHLRLLKPYAGDDKSKSQ